jgi:hypothetical protein
VIRESQQRIEDRRRQRSVRERENAAEDGDDEQLVPPVRLRRGGRSDYERCAANDVINDVVIQVINGKPTRILYEPRQFQSNVTSGYRFGGFASLFGDSGQAWYLS